MSSFKDGINVFDGQMGKVLRTLSRPKDRIKENVNNAHNVEKFRQVADNSNEFLGYVNDNPTKSVNHFENQTVHTFADRPIPVYRTLAELLIADRVQRPFDAKWCWKIVSNYDPNKSAPITVLKIKNPKDGKWYYYICDGQHTATSLAMRSYYGFEEGFGPENYLENTILTVEITCEDFAIARETFLSHNLDKLALEAYDIWVIQCLGKKIDYKDTICEDHPEWETAGEFYDAMSKYGIRPVSKGSADKTLPGALSDISKFMTNGKTKVSEIDWEKDDYDFVFAMHKLNFDYLSMSSFEYNPWRFLKNTISGETDFNKDSDAKQFYQDLGNLIRTFTETPAGWMAFARETWQEFLNVHQVQATLDDNMSMLLLLECYEKAGGTFTKKRVDMKKFRDNVYKNMQHEKNLVDCIGKDKISMLENTAESNTDVK
jgi:hypothetical protein